MDQQNWLFAVACDQVMDFYATSAGANVGSARAMAP